MINDLTINKLIILYILTKTNSPMDNSDLVDFMLQNDYSDYFNIQKYLGDLLNSKFIHKINQERKSYYMITPEGANALEYFTNRIPKDYIDVMNTFCAKFINDYEEVILYNSNIYEYASEKYQLNCSITQNNTEVLNIKFSDLSKEKAENMCECWKNNATLIHEYLKEKLEY